MCAVLDCGLLIGQTYVCVYTVVKFKPVSFEKESQVSSQLWTTDKYIK